MCLAVPGEVLSVRADRAEVSVNGVVVEAGIALADGIGTGDWVLLHAGFIIEKVDREEAEQTLKALREYSNVLGP